MSHSHHIFHKIMISFNSLSVVLLLLGKKVSVYSMTEWKENGDDAHWRRLKTLMLLLVAKVLKAHAFEKISHLCSLWLTKFKQSTTLIIKFRHRFPSSDSDLGNLLVILTIILETRIHVMRYILLASLARYRTFCY